MRMVQVRLRTLAIWIAILCVGFAIARQFPVVLQYVQDTTQYARGFSEARFRLIRAGDSESHVISLLGPPLKTMVEPEEIHWHYAPIGYLVHENGAVSDLCLPCTIVFATSDEIVTGFSGSYFTVNPGTLVGLSLADVKKRFGSPRVQRRRPFKKELFYSESDRDGSYFRRAIYVNSTRTVTEIVADFYQD